MAINKASLYHKALPGSANLANLLPTGTIFVFQSIIPSFSNNGKCVTANKYMTWGFIILCSLACFLSSFTDSFVGRDGKIYYGIASPKGLIVFNDDYEDALDLENNKDKEMLRKYRLTFIDFVHAFSSLALFLVIAFSSLDVQGCIFPEPGSNGKALIKNLPLAVGGVASVLFMLFPTKRRGIGHADRPQYDDTKEKTQTQKTSENETPANHHK